MQGNPEYVAPDPKENDYSEDLDSDTTPETEGRELRGADDEPEDNLQDLEDNTFQIRPSVYDDPNNDLDDF